MNYSDYKNRITDDIRQTLSQMGCQPILFIGSGLSRRYAGTYNWVELLNYLANACPYESRGLGYYQQLHPTLDVIGSELAGKYREWAWGDGRALFPEEYFTPAYSSDIYIKSHICRYFQDACMSFNAKESFFSSEIQSLKDIRPHAVITTNYDTILETVFPDYSSVIGQKLIRANFVTCGEIYKIHGCVTDPSSLVFTHGDYEEFLRKKKYLSAKLLTYFAEHPLLFIGYSASDANIASILSDIDEILSPNGDIIENIYLLEWRENITDKFEKIETTIYTEQGKHVRVKSIVANDFKWVFDAFNAGEISTAVDPKLLRKLLANTYKLVRHDFPRKDLNVDFQLLESACESSDNLAKLFGVTLLDSPESLAAHYPYLLSQLGEILGYAGWHSAHSLMKSIEEKNSIRFQSSDNPYHIMVKTSRSASTGTRKYSEKMLDLLRKAKEGKPYIIEHF